MNFLWISSISQVHEFLGFEKPVHPLITIIRKWPKLDFDFSAVKLVSDLFLVGMKGSNGKMGYGRNSYDYQAGTMIFTSPQQVLYFDNNQDNDDEGGWSIIFHPDLILKSDLYKAIANYAFFAYDIHEALHLSEKEKLILSGFLEHIETEINQNIDRHSQELIVTNLTSILQYCQRYYDRQFYTRTNLNKDFISQFEQFLITYFESEDLQKKGVPTVTDCGKALKMSASYLSDLLRIETGRSAKDHIYDLVIKKAKNVLLNSTSTVSEIAYGLGFEYPQHFSKLFRSKTGYSPSEFRNLN